MKIGVVIVCAGKGERLGRDKAILEFGGRHLFLYTVNTFIKIKDVKQIVLVLRKTNFSSAKRIIKDKKILIVEGGKERKDSVWRGLSVLNKNIDYVLIHDGARPFVSPIIIGRIIKELKHHPAVICGIKLRDAVKSVNKNVVAKTLAREKILLVQTPQGFKKNLIVNAYKKLQDYPRIYKKHFVDDAQILEVMGKKIKWVEGDISNIKITYPEDLRLAQAILNIQDMPRFAQQITDAHGL